MTSRAALTIALAVAATLWCRFAASGSVDDSAFELWPFFESVRSDELQSVTIRPLFKVVSSRRDQTRRVDVLYPFFKWQTGPDDSMQWWLMPITYYLRDVDTEGRTDTDMAVLPVLFTGSSSDGTEDYLAVFPIGGTTKQLLFFDKITFVAFPVYVRLERGDYVSRNVLWPVFGRGEGPHESAWRVWPIYGERRVDDALRFRTVLWPIYSEWHKDESSSVMVFPLYHSIRSESKRLWSVLPPVFSYDIVPENEFRRWRAPWPLIEVVRSETWQRTNVWPVWGRTDRPGEKASFVLWPAFTYQETRRDKSRERHTRFLVFGVADTIEDETGEPTDRYVQLWPVFHWSAGRDPGVTEFNVLSPLWFRRGAERFWDMYGPFWTLYRHETHEDGGAADYALGRILAFERGPERKRTSFWPIFEYARDIDSSKIEVLKGLFTVRRESDERYIRLLWLLKVPMEN